MTSCLFFFLQCRTNYVLAVSKVGRQAVPTSKCTSDAQPHKAASVTLCPHLEPSKKKGSVAGHLEDHEEGVSWGF